jgi:ATP-dependent DNA helicase DinG
VRFEQAREWLLKEFEAKLPIYIQGMGSNVVEEFKRAPNGILLGMEAFGEGIDIPGDDLQFLLVDKIPDLRQDLVIQARRDFYEKNFGNEFYDYFMAHRTRSLHQKIGRLIRRSSDRGGAIIVDSRIKSWKGNTLNKFKQLMLPYQIDFKSMEQAVDEIKSFLKLDD